MMQFILYELTMQETLCGESLICQTRVLVQCGRIYSNLDVVWFVLDRQQAAATISHRDHEQG